MWDFYPLQAINVQSVLLSHLIPDLLALVLLSSGQHASLGNLSDLDTGYLLVLCAPNYLLMYSPSMLLSQATWKELMPP